MCIRDKRTKEIIKDEELQRIYLQLQLSKELSVALKNSKLNFKFEYLIISFQYSPYICYEERVDEEEKNKPCHNAKLVNLPNLYFEVKKLNESKV
jgi:hypothetical protein